MANKFDCKLTNLWNKYKNNDKSVFCDSFAFFIEQAIFIKLEQTGEISELERMFLIDYMQAGIMNNDDILSYEYLRTENPSVKLPEVDF